MSKRGLRTGRPRGPAARGRDKMATSDFLTTLWGTVPPGRVLVWTLPDKASCWYSTFDTVDADVLRLEHRDVYTGVGLAPTTGVRLTAHNRIREHQVAGVAGFWADIDVAHPVHKMAAQLPPTAELALEALADLPYQPTLIVDSGHGLQLWWLLERPWLFDTPEERELARRASQWWHSIIKDLFQHKGWTVDPTFDLSRVMRLPGTWNHKAADDLRRVAVTGGTGERYPVSRFLDLVPYNFTADGGRPRRQRNEGKGGGSPVTASLIADPEPAPAPWLLETLLQIDPRFRQTWEQRRPDLPDQSPSGYDMALAHAAVRAGWPDQEVAHLLIAFRRKHKHAPKLREDYHALTISKARASLERPGDAAGPRDDFRSVEKPGDSRKEGAGVHNEALPSSTGDDATGGSDTEIGKGGEGISDVVHLLETVRRLVMQDPPAADCRDPAVLRLVTEIRGALTGPAASPEATSAAAQLLAGCSAYASSGQIEDLDVLAAAAAAAMGPEVQLPLLVRDAADALTKGTKSVEPLMALAAMLRRQTTSVRNRAKIATLAEAAELPLPRSILKAKGKNGSLLDAGEVAVLSGMGGAGKSTFTAGLALELMVLGQGVRGEIGGVFEAEGGLVLLVGYEDRLARVGRRARPFAEYMDRGNPNRPFDAARRQVQAMEMRHPLFGPDPFTPLYNARPTALDGWQEVRDRAGSVRPSLLVIDPALCAYVGDANSPAAVSEFLMSLRDLAEDLDCGVMLVTHGTKGSRGGGRRKVDPTDPGHVLGSGSWTDRARCAMTLTPGPGGHSTLTVFKANYGPQRISIEMSPLVNDRGNLIGFSGLDRQWKPLPLGEGETDRGNRPPRHAGGKGLFDD